jgi:hypothetical protein
MDTYGREAYERLAVRLNVSAAALMAVAEVESSGTGFLPIPSRSPEGLDVSGRPVIRFEAHVFWKELRSRGVDPATVDAPRGDLLRPALALGLTKTRAGEWDRLEAARTIDRDAADRSASWGAFQIMGFNAVASGAADTADFVRRMETPEGQLELFAGFLEGNPGMVKALKKRDWSSFAYLYNGKLYQVNGYHVKLEAAWKKAAKNV